MIEPTSRDDSLDPKAVQAALMKAARQAMRQARVHDGLVPVWEDGQVKWVRPEEIEAALDQAEQGDPP